MVGIPHPYATPGLPGIGGTIKQVPEDFLVTEVPLYPPCGEGEHTYFEVEKTDLSTLEALERIGKALGVDARDIGYAGLKDRKGVTRQTLSLAGVTPEAVAALAIPQVKVLWATRHRNKLRVGHLKGNRFEIRVRGVSADAKEKIEPILQALLEKGTPNYYGPQRFGSRGDAHRVGRSFLLGDPETGIRRILGRPAPTEQNPHVVEARSLFMAGALSDSLSAYPVGYREERRLLSHLIRSPGDYAGAYRRMGEVTRKLFLTAYQSFLFNVALSRRLETSLGDLGAFYEGDLAFLHRNGAVFRVEGVEECRPRANAFEISPSGPIFGSRMLVPGGVEGQIEAELLGSEGIDANRFERLRPTVDLEGGRRPFRVRVENLSSRVEGNDLCLDFFLPKGSYATTFLRELLKCEQVPEAFYEEGDEGRHRLWRPPSPSKGPAPRPASAIDGEGLAPDEL